MAASRRSTSAYIDKPPPPISRDELVAEVLSYYEFLVSMYLPEDALKRPPPEGWPGITAERLAFLQKDDTVIDILKHLPYIRLDKSDPQYFIYHDCCANDYSGQNFERYVTKYRSREGVDPVPEALQYTVDESLHYSSGRLPPHIFTLALGDPGDDGFFIFCDTKDDTMSLVNFMKPTNFQTGVRSFFRALKDEFRDLALVPYHEHRHLRSVNPYWWDPEKYGALQDIYRKHGWPSDDYRKAACLAELDEISEKEIEKSLQK